MAPGPIVSGISKTILLVDDEPDIRLLVGQVLRRNGFRVLSASGGRQALQRCHQHQGPIHLVLTDLLMPEMNGLEMATQLVVLRPDTRVVYMSDSRVIRNAFGSETKLAFVEKPFTPDALIKKIHQVLHPFSEPIG